MKTVKISVAEAEKYNMENHKYIVAVVSPNSWNSDGSPIFERECAHNHRSLGGARRCQIKLLAYSRDRNTHSAAWHNSKIFRADHTRLTEDEREDLDSIGF
jgi:hypothetical protein